MTSYSARCGPSRPRILVACCALFALTWLVACQSAPPPSPQAPAQTSPLPTEPTAAPGRPTATATFAPLTDATEPIVLEPPEAEPTATLEPPPVHLPDSNLALFRPGPGSQATSPLRVVGRGGPSLDERVRVRLLDPEGGLLAERTTILFAYPGNAGRFATNLPFQIPGVSITATIQLDTFDLRYGLLAHRFSQDVVLLSAGSERIRPGHQGPSQLAILSPRDGAVLPTGTIFVSGGGWSTGTGQIVVQALDRNGTVIASTPAELSTEEIGRIGTFEVTLDIPLNRPQYGRLAVAEMDADRGEPRFLQSIEVYFRPP